MELHDLRVLINIPFCARTCTYCDAAVYDHSTSGMRAAYMAALENELAAAHDSFTGYRLRTIYVTGGTPTTVDPKSLSALIEHVKQSCETAPDLEVSIATNPGGIGTDALSQFKHVGVSRFDIGLATLHPLEFQTLVRPYGWNDVHFTQMLFEFASFRDYSFDVLYGIPGQTPGTLRDTIEEALEIVPAPTHMTLLPLRVVPGTPLYRRFVEGDASVRIDTHGRMLPDRDTLEALYQRGCETLEKAGFERYTLHHFAKPGSRCRHFELSCRDTDVLGLGLAAQSFCDGILSQNTADLQTYLDANGDPARLTSRAVLLDGPSREARFLAAGLSGIDGVRDEDFRARFGHGFEEGYGETFERLAEKNLAVLLRSPSGQLAGVALTPQGAFEADSVFAQLQAAGQQPKE